MDIGLGARLRAARNAAGSPRASAQLGTLAQGGWLLAATIVAGVLNYLANVMVGKLLGPEQYGVFTALLALAVVFGTPAAVIQTVIANYAARLSVGAEGEARVGSLLKAALRALLPWTLGGAVLIGLGSTLIASFLHIQSRVPVMVLAGSLLTATLLPVSYGGLQGLQRFAQLGGGQMGQAALRLSLAIAFVLLGWGAAGALAGSVLSGLVIFLLAQYWLRDLYARARSPGEKPYTPVRWKDGVSRFTVLVVISMLAFTLLMNGDVLAVKNRFGALDAGLYSAVMTVGRIVLFIPATIVGLMLPKVAAKHAQGRPTAVLARRSLLATVALCGVAALAFLAWPQLIMRTLFGTQFLGQVGLLGAYGVAMLLLALVNVWIQYFLAVQESRYTWVVLAGAVSMLVVLFVAPLSLSGIVWTLIGFNAALVLAGEGLLRYGARRGAGADLGI